MKTLTLEQVREAGRFAWCYMTDTFYAEGSFWTAFEMGDEEDGGLGVFDECESIAESRVRECEQRLGRHPWHHLPGCDCEFCA